MIKTTLKMKMNNLKNKKKKKTRNKKGEDWLPTSKLCVTAIRRGRDETETEKACSQERERHAYMAE